MFDICLTLKKSYVDHLFLTSKLAKTIHLNLITSKTVKKKLVSPDFLILKC
jgi:hypothetical protein